MYRRNSEWSHCIGNKPKAGVIYEWLPPQTGPNCDR